MKGISLTLIIIILTSCAYNAKTNEFQQGSRSSAVVTTPVYYDPPTIVEEDPIEVTTTTVDYY